MITNSKIHLPASISLIKPALKAQVSIYCGLGIYSIPLLVDEGYLFVGTNGKLSKLFVRKSEYGTTN